MNVYLRRLKSLLINIVKASIIGLVCMWMTFWYLSGSFYGLPQFLFVYGSAYTMHYHEIPRKQIFEGALYGMTEALKDPFSSYMSPADFSKFMQRSEGNYVGVGILLEAGAPYNKVADVFPGGPAQAAGIEPGDIIVSVNGKSIKGLPSFETVSLITGPVDSEVTLGIVRGASDVVQEFTMKRAVIHREFVISKMLTSQIGYIRVEEFGEKTGEEFKAAYEQLRSEGMTKLILDLRGNPGGLLSTATEIGDMLLPGNGPIVTMQSRFDSMPHGPEFHGQENPIPVVVLVNHGSASASEIIAAAVQDYGVGIVMGQTTYGKGTVQSILRGPGGNAVRITISEYKTPAGRSINKTGITPDIIVESNENRYPYKTDDMEVQQAIHTLETETVTRPSKVGAN